MTYNTWINDNYKMLYDVAKNINQGKGDHEDLLHYAIEQFLTNPKAQALVDKGHAKWFLIRILSTSAKSKTSGFWREYRGGYTSELLDNQLPSNEEYDIDMDIILEWLAGMIEDMIHSDVENWYRGTILQLCLKQKKLNFSELSRDTGIPRTSLSNAYSEALEIIKQKIETYGNDYDTFRNHLINYLADKS
jgi:DNA-directed RNA polymerase specialized sigma24 family protein